MIDETNLHAAQVDRVRRIVDYVVDCGAVHYGELFALFADASLSDWQARNTFNKRVNYLVAQKRLEFEGTLTRRIFTPGPLATPHNQPKLATVPNSPNLPNPPTKATPRVVDLLFGPVYVPGPGPVLRPGALDHQQCKSLRTQR